MTVVVNHLHFRDPLTDDVVQTCRDRVGQEVGGPWMRQHVLPLLARGPERSVGEVVADGSA